MEAKYLGKIGITMEKLKEYLKKLYKGIYKLKLRHRIILVNVVCVLIPLIMSHLYFISTIRNLRAKQGMLQSDAKLIFKHNWQGLLIIGISIIISLIIIVAFSYHYSNRLTAFQRVMNKTAAGDFDNLELIDGHDEISELYRDLNTLINSIQHLVSTVYEEQVQKERLYSRQKDVEFKMLASQINPHFLYNTLETIRMKARCSGEKEIEELVKMLAKIMRRNIQVGDKLVTLKSELELVEYYLRIQQYRFGERIHYSIDVKCDIEFLKIMPLLIQPVVENAFVHGLETKEGEGEIRIVVERTDRLRIHIIDNGNGMSEAKLNEIIESLNDFSKLDRNHIGLNNVNQRIKLLYGDDYGIFIKSKAGEGTTVIIEIPEDITK